MEPSEILERLTRERGGCAKCGLSTRCGSPFMRGKGNPNEPLIAVVGEAPSGSDDQTGLPFTGPQGEVIRSVVRGILSLQLADSCYLTNAIRCRPADKVNKTMIESCRSFLVDEMFAVRPKVIVGLGGAALESLTGRTGIIAERGVLQMIKLRSSWGEERQFLFMPSVHPNYVLNNPAALDYLVMDMRNAKTAAEQGGVPELPKTKYRVVRTARDLTTLKNEVAKADRVAWDTETSGVNPYVAGASVICVSVSTKPGTGWLIPFDHEECAGMKLHTHDRLDLVKWILCESGKPLVGQNLKFDATWIIEHFGFRPNPPAFDTYIAHHLLREEESEHGGNGLKAMAWKYTNMGGYERPLETRFPDMYKRMRTLPLEPGDDLTVHQTLTWYACADVDVALQIMDVLEPQLKEQNLMEVLELEHDKSEFLVDMEMQGQAIDWEYQAELEKRFPETIEGLLEKLRSYPEVIKLETKFAMRKYKGDPDLFGGKTVPFNPNSRDQVSMLCLDVLELPVLSGKGRQTKTGKQSTDKHAMAEWMEMCDGPALEILKLIEEYKSMQQLYSLYVKAIPEHRCKDGKVHAKFNGAKVVTWRLSAEDPNVMQLPQAGPPLEDGRVGKGDIKRMYISGFTNGFIMEADYSQIELRIAALISQDKAMIDEYWKEDNDLHRRTAASIYGIAEEDVRDDQRSYAKTINFGTIYGMQAQSLARRTGVDEWQAQSWLDSFFDTYFGFADWMEKTKQFAKKHGYVESLFGHRRHLPNVFASNYGLREDALRQAVNSPIQATASNLSIYAGMYLSRLLREERFDSRIQANVHDSLQLTGPRRELDKCIETTTLVMENLPFDFLTGEDPRFPAAVPIVVEVKVGTNLRDLKKI